MSKTTKRPSTPTKAAASSTKSNLAANLATDLRDHGVAVHNGSTLSLRPWRDPSTGRDYVYVGITCFPSLVVQVDVTTGRCRQFDLPNGASGPWGMAFTLDGDILVTSCDGQLLRINPKSGKVTSEARTGHWLWCITPAADGKFYLGSSSKSAMFRYDPITRETEEVARFDKTDKYLRHLIGGADGYVYGSVGCADAQIVAYHIASGKSKTLLPASEVGPDFHRLHQGADGKIYVRTVKNNLFRLDHGEAFPVVEGKVGVPAMGTASRWGGYAAPRLPDGRLIRVLDPDTLQIGEGPDAKLIPYHYKTQGASIFHLAEGPNNDVYASTIMPLYLLRYSPKTKKLENLGRGGMDNGEAYSFGHCDGKLYYATYSTGQLMMYDPARPWHKDLPGAMKWQDNPRHIGALGVGHCRPRAMCVDSKKRVWVGSHAEYGKTNGGLACYDTVADKLRNNPIVIPDQSIHSLAADTDKDIVYGATDIVRGSGMDPNTKEAHLFAWDGAKQKLLWKLKPLKGQTGIINLLYRDGKLYGTSRPTYSFFCFDIATQKMDYFIESKIDCCREESMIFGPDGNIYGITYLHFFQWNPETGDVKSLYSTTPEQAATHHGGSLFHRGAVISDGRFYFSCAGHVMSLRLPKPPKKQG